MAECVDSRAPKFAFVSHVLPPSWSGQAVVIGRLLRDMDPRSYCLISRQDNQQDGHVRSLSGHYYCLGAEKQIPINRSVFWDINVILSILQRGWKIARILIAEECRTAVVGTGDLVDLPAARLACFFSGAKFYAYYFDDYVYQWMGKIRKRADLFERIIFNRIEGLIVPNEFLWKEMMSRRNMNAVIIHNPCESIPEKHDPGMEESKKGDIRIVYTGAVYHVNFGAIRNLISALEMLKRPDIKLHLYTAQSEEWLAEHGIKGDYVVHHNHVSHPEVVQAQSSAYILFIPFDFHSPVPEVVRTSAPGKLGDYLASGTPILAHVPSDTFVNWYLKKYQCGVVADRDSAEYLKKTLIQLLEDEKLRKSIRRNALDRARLDFDPVVMKQKLMAMLGGWS